MWQQITQYVKILNVRLTGGLHGLDHICEILALKIQSSKGSTGQKHLFNIVSCATISKIFPLQS